MKKVAFLTTFFESQSGFSVITVTGMLMRMLLDHDYMPIVLVQPQYVKHADGATSIKPFGESPRPSVWNRDTVDLRQVVPAMELIGGGHPKRDEFEARVQKIYDALAENLADVDVCITQDIMLLDSYTEHNVAVRRYAAERPDLLWLHWIHSRPSGEKPPVPAEHWATRQQCRHNPVPGYLVYPNESQANYVARTYKMSLERIIACRAGHAVDPLELMRADELTRAIVARTDALGGDILTIAPMRTEPAKGADKIIWLMAGLHQLGYEPRIIVIDWQSQGEAFKKHKAYLRELAEEAGIGDWLHFTSEVHDAASQGVPTHVVYELLQLSHVYFLPSRSETYGKVAHEAMLAGCLCVLNYDVRPLFELFGNHAIYMDFGSIDNTRKYHPDPRVFFTDQALRLAAELRANRVVTAKMQAHQWTPARLWRELAPLLYLPPVGADGAPG